MSQFHKSTDFTYIGALCQNRKLTVLTYISRNRDIVYNMSHTLGKFVQLCHSK